MEIASALVKYERKTSFQPSTILVSVFWRRCEREERKEHETVVP
jgi:hypothetical protein